MNHWPLAQGTCGRSQGSKPQSATSSFQMRSSSNPSCMSVVSQSVVTCEYKKHQPITQIRQLGQARGPMLESTCQSFCDNLPASWLNLVLFTALRLSACLCLASSVTFRATPLSCCDLLRVSVALVKPLLVVLSGLLRCSSLPEVLGASSSGSGTGTGGVSARRNNLPLGVGGSCCFGRALADSSLLRAGTCGCSKPCSKSFRYAVHAALLRLAE